MHIVLVVGVHTGSLRIRERVREQECQPLDMDEWGMTCYCSSIGSKTAVIMWPTGILAPGARRICEGWSLVFVGVVECKGSREKWKRRRGENKKGN